MAVCTSTTDTLARAEAVPIEAVALLAALVSVREMLPPTRMLGAAALVSSDTLPFRAAATVTDFPLSSLKTTDAPTPVWMITLPSSTSSTLTSIL